MGSLMPPVWFYDLLYRWRAPWEGGARLELTTLVEQGRLTPVTLAPGRAVDLGCGSGANAVFLAQAGFEVVGIDFSPVALGKARRAAEAAGVSDRLRLVRGDLTSPRMAEIEGPFDLLVDFGTLDDLGPAARRAMAATIIRLARPGSAFLLWCFYADRASLPPVSLTGPSRMVPSLAPGEERRLFGDAFGIERLPAELPEQPTAAFLMTRRPEMPG
jgi:SAM-dependent methyltransferase